MEWQKLTRNKSFECQSYSLALNSRGHNKEGGRLTFLLKEHKLGGLLIGGGSVLNRQYGDPNISKSLQIVVNIA